MLSGSQEEIQEFMMLFLKMFLEAPFHNLFLCAHYIGGKQNIFFEVFSYSLWLVSILRDKNSAIATHEEKPILVMK